MRIKKFFLVALLVICFTLNLNAGERSIPVDMILMIDKSLSMQEAGKFDSLQKWVLNELVGQMLTEGDWISIYQFYEKQEHVISVDIKNKDDKQKVIAAISNIKPNGKYTDIGSALDTINTAVKNRGKNERQKVLLIITDLEQDAPLTSKYAGKQSKFKTPYLVEARIIKHDKWYEITLDMDIQSRVVQTTKQLFSNIILNNNKSRVQSDENDALIKQKTP